MSEHRGSRQNSRRTPLRHPRPRGLTRRCLGSDALDFFVYSRDAAGASALRDDDDLLEAHWSYMDRFAESMIARGPTLDADRRKATGSLHVLGLPSVDAAEKFVVDEPNNRAGVYADHAVWRFENLLGRTMWEFSGAIDEPRFLVIARSRNGEMSRKPIPPENLPAEALSATDPVRHADQTRQPAGGRRARRSRAGQRSTRRAPRGRSARTRRGPRDRGTRLGARRSTLTKAPRRRVVEDFRRSSPTRTRDSHPGAGDRWRA